MTHKRRIACILAIKSQNVMNENLISLAQACFRFTPQIAVRSGEAIFLEIGKSLGIFSEESLKKRVLSLASRLGLEVRVSFAATPNQAFAQAMNLKFEKTKSFSDLSLEALVWFLPPFQRDIEVEKRVLKWMPFLNHLGIKSFGDFLSVPTQLLGIRFGKEAVLIAAIAKEEVEVTWQGFHPPCQIREVLDLQDNDLEGTEVQINLLLFALRSLIDRALCRVRGLSQRISRLQITLTLSPWSTVKNHKRIWIIPFPVPQGGQVGVMFILRDFLSQQLSQEPLLAPARSLEVLILETVPGHGSQKDFFNSKEIEKENWDQLLGRLLSQLGEGYVFQAVLVERYRPEKSWQRALRQTSSGKESSSLNFVVRPSRMLKEPEPILLQSHLILMDGVLSKKAWKVEVWEGPERISSEWWKESELKRVDRDYYQVTTSEKEKLWIFIDRTIDPPCAFLHGYFD